MFNPLPNEPPDTKGSNYAIRSWDRIDKAVLSLSRWQEPVYCVTAKSAEQRDGMKLRLQSASALISLKWTDQDRSNRGSSSAEDSSFKVRSVLFLLCLSLFFSTLPFPPSTSSTLCEQTGCKSLLRITRDIHFTFECFALFPLIGPNFHISRTRLFKVLLTWVITDLQGSFFLFFSSMHQRTVWRKAESFLCCLLHYVVLM